ncbi:MAG: DUF5652 family protein [Patescibacteria group bacterium]
MLSFMQNVGVGSGYPFPLWASASLMLFMAWCVFWKGLALWHSARRKQGWWFIFLFLVNTAGILEIVYLFGIAKIPASQLLNAKK